MTLDRRTAMVAPIAIALAGGAAGAMSVSGRMFGLIGKMRAKPGRRDALVALLLEGSTTMPGCLSYVVALDAKDADGIWVTEVWNSGANHKASLRLPSVRAAITKARPLVAGFEPGATTIPVGGIGLVRS